MLKNLRFVSRNKSNVFLLVLALTVGGVGAQATGVLNTQAGGYLVCVNSKTKVVTHPGTSKCPKGTKRLVLSAQGTAGKDGNTVWNSTTDPISTFGAPGDFFINSATNTLFGPKNSDGTWPAGVSMAGPKGDQGPIGLTGATGPRGLSGGSGPAGPTGPTGPTGVAAPVVTGAANCIPPATSCTYKVGDTGPGGGIIFFVDYFNQYVGINYLEAAPQGWGNNISVNPGEATGSTTVDPLMKWCSDTTTLLNLNDWSNSGVGKGATNTATAGIACTAGAIQAAADYEGGGKTDWFLPSVSEAVLMYANLRQIGVGGFIHVDQFDDYYWTSSEVNATEAWLMGFRYGTPDLDLKAFIFYVRPVRAFQPVIYFPIH